MQVHALNQLGFRILVLYFFLICIGYILGKYIKESDANNRVKAICFFIDESHKIIFDRIKKIEENICQIQKLHAIHNHKTH